MAVTQSAIPVVLGCMLRLLTESLLRCSAKAVVGVGGEAGVGSDLAQHDVGRALVAPFDADRVLDPLQALHPWSLRRRLDEVAREDRRGRPRAVQVEPAALQGGLDRTVLLLRDGL